MRKTGTIAAWTDADGRRRFRARIHLKDGTRPWHSLPPNLTREEAKAIAGKLQRDEDDTAPLQQVKEERARVAAELSRQSHPLETADAWFIRYLPTTAGGEANREQHAHNWHKWITPTLGQKAMASLTREDVEDVVAVLDRAIDDGEIREKTASNIWSTFKLALVAANASKNRSLRCLTSPIYYGVLPPKRGRSRHRPWLYPNEWVRLAKCKAVPVEWLRVYAVAVYTGLRPNEHRVLLGSDVDLKALQTNVSKAWDSRVKVVGPPKTPAAYRNVPVEPNLVTLMKVLTKDRRDQPVSPILSVDAGRDAAIIFRSHLQLAGIDRARLFTENQTEEKIDFRSLRDTYATWLALSGLELSRIQRRLGHTSPETTNKYVKAAESFDPAAIGEPFPVLPKRLYE